MAYYKPIEQQLAIKIQNNATCPCKSKIKYKKCCKGKQLFFKSESDKQRAEFFILEREKQNGANKST